MVRLAIACDPESFHSQEVFAAHLAQGQRLLASSIERSELSDGWALRLPNDDDTFLAVAHWTVAERRCCPFFTFVLEREPIAGALWLRITGPHGAKLVLDGAFAGSAGTSP
jgi:hypothetical protein